MINNIRVRINLAIYDPFYQWEFEDIRNFFMENYFLVVRIANIFYIKTYQNKEAVYKTLNKKFKNVYFEIEDPETDKNIFNDSEYIDQEILNRREIKSSSDEEEFLNSILDKIHKKEDVSLEEKFFLEYYSNRMKS
jgi:hypothetical protein